MAFNDWLKENCGWPVNLGKDEIGLARHAFECGASQGKREVLEGLKKVVFDLHERYDAQSFRGVKYEGAEMASRTILDKIDRKLKELEKENN